MKRVVGHNSTVYLISCVKKKRPCRAEAQDLYESSWFKKARRYVESSGARWFILSAKYGLVSPDEVIEPYEKSLNTMPAAERREWAEKVFVQLNDVVPTLETAVFLAGRRYREFLSDHLQKRGIVINVPMERLGIGKQLQWLDKNG